MLMAVTLMVSLLTGAGPLADALSATEAPNTLRAAFTVELESKDARRVYDFDPRRAKAERWQLVAWDGEDDELDAIGANWASEAAPDGRLFPNDLRSSLGERVEVDELGGAWRVHFRHHPSHNDGEFDVWAAERLQAAAWVDPGSGRFLRLDYALAEPVDGPSGGKLTEYRQSYFLRTEPRWGMSYVSGFSVNMNGRAGLYKIDRRYAAKITRADFFFANPSAQAAFEATRAPLDASASN